MVSLHWFNGHLYNLPVILWFISWKWNYTLSAWADLINNLWTKGQDGDLSVELDRCLPYTETGRNRKETFFF